jgi:hypothetical protein
MSHPLRWLALVALERPALPTAEELSAWLREAFPGSGPASSAGGTDHLLTFTYGEYTAAITLIPRPIPASQLEGPAATAWYWPGAAEELSNHAAHLLVALIDEGGSAVKKAQTLTQLAAAAAATTPSIGVVWGPGRLVHASGAFIDQAVQMTGDDLPLFLWIDFRIEGAGDGQCQLFTTGLDALGQSELEAPAYLGSPQELRDFAYNIAHYLTGERRRHDRADGPSPRDGQAWQVDARRGAGCDPPGV